ncbi:hypothetical protein BOSEA31B_10355 [Hyphomicrobiales bacterium]|nr:hypothetical protein BOSEA31B_10355 [Hyphomicrobiales bacterium]CAH1702036.1 hypothetical protein BOSEA1005_21735 [Hyphomicrobiales bacterium]CAI0346193.1 hypothetical protein BO1005MUT1_490005 [Hyphomicrobiales bacterium]
MHNRKMFTLNFDVDDRIARLAGTFMVVAVA